MSAPKAIPHRKVCLSLPEPFLDRLKQYPGEQSTKIQILCEYALEMGALMTFAEARKLAGPRITEAIRTSRKIPELLENL